MSGSTDTLGKAIGQKLREVIQRPERPRRAGLVFFSDDAYPLLYPCAKRENFARIIHDVFLHRKQKLREVCSQYGCTKDLWVVHPWVTPIFIAGTKISTGLKVALEQYRAYPHVRNAPIVLISDLQNGEEEGVLEGVLSEYGQLGIPLRIFHLSEPIPGFGFGYGDYEQPYREHVRNVLFRVDARTLPPSPGAGVPSKVHASYVMPRKPLLLATAAFFGLLLSEFVLPLRTRRRAASTKRRISR